MLAWTALGIAVDPVVSMLTGMATLGVAIVGGPLTMSFLVLEMTRSVDVTAAHRTWHRSVRASGEGEEALGILSDERERRRRPILHPPLELDLLGRLLGEHLARDGDWLLLERARRIVEAQRRSPVSSITPSATK